MTHKSFLNLFLFISLILCNTSPLFSVNIELFSLDFNEKGEAKVNILYNSAYDEEQIKKDAEETKQNEEDLKQCIQNTEKKTHKIKKIPLEKEIAKKNRDKKRKLAEEIISKL